jgi:hypothetical protein
MMFNVQRKLPNLLFLLCLVLLPVSIPAQTGEPKKPRAKSSEKEPRTLGEVDFRDAERRAFAVSLITSLANEALSYRDQTLRPRVLARAGDALWDVNRDTARLLFRRAWEEAEKGDAEELTLKTTSSLPETRGVMIASLRRATGRDLRAEVLALAALRDSALGEEFLNKLKEETKRASADFSNDSGLRNTSDSWTGSEAAAKRLQLARTLLEGGEIERALEFATPALDQVNANSIGFLSALRAKSPNAADQRFASLIARVEFAPTSDANTVSGLSSYIFTPGLYVTFNVDGHTRWAQPDETTSPPTLPAGLINKFFQVAASILLRPLPRPDEDFTSSGRTGKYMVIQRLLPLFDQYAPDTAAALRSQLTALKDDPSKKVLDDDSNPLLTQGLQHAEPTGDAGGKMQDQLDHAKTSLERDLIYEQSAVTLANQGDTRALDLSDKIEDSDRRTAVHRYVDFEFVRRAIQKKDALEVARLAKAERLTHTQRAWAYIQAARLLVNSERPRALEFLDDAANEARRIDGDSPDRVLLLVGVAQEYVTADSVRAWEIMAEAVKAANSIEKFTGENVQLHFPIMTKGGLKTTDIGGKDFGLSRVIRSLTKEDLYRSVGLAKSFKNDAPRAAATLALANAVLEK